MIRRNPSTVTSSAGDIARYEYDSLNRLQSVVSNGKEVLNHEYEETEVDMRIQADHKTMRTILPGRRASVVFGSAAETIYTRTVGTPLGPVIFDEDLLAFRPVADTGVVLEDAATYDALRRMRLINQPRKAFSDKDRFEQPSNVLFLPPEYVSMNCCLPCDPITQAHLCGTCRWPEGADDDICWCSPGEQCQESGAFESPPPTPLPPVQEVSSLPPNSQGFHVWGSTDAHPLSETFCREVCIFGETYWRLEGDIRLTSGSVIKVSTTLPDVGTCYAAPRTQSNIEHTRIHETTHAQGYARVTNDMKAFLGSELYLYEAACEASKISLDGILNYWISVEYTRQDNHLDHAGERRHAAVCPSPGDATDEIVCGLGGWQCDPYGNFYPGQ